jgi:bifunctional UDP-N-acetylglucosamine pyrophosphorylase/glucosamine-1-phosphate N-acetyltransferase
VILAAGEGSRMRSERPKPLHYICGRPMLLHVIDALAALNVGRVVVVVGHGADPVTKTLVEHGPPGVTMEFVEQRDQRGTGDAALVALTAFPDDIDDDDVLVLPGDTPLLKSETLVALVREHRVADAGATVLTADIDNPAGYGRVVRGKDDSVARIVESADASPDELSITEINTGIYCFRRPILAPALRRLTPENAQGEYYLTDVVEVLADAGYRVSSHTTRDQSETAGINDRSQLAEAEAVLRMRINERLMRGGVTMLDPERTYIDASVTIAPDTTVWPGTMLQGRTTVGARCRIGPDVRLVDCTVGDDTVIEQTTGREATVGNGAWVGPYGVLHQGSVVPDGVRTGAYHEALPEG